MKVARWTAACLACLVFMAASDCQALDPNRDLKQLHHTAWTIETGAPADVWALAQTGDGFLWLGTGAGLLRFDGVRFEKVQLEGEGANSNNVNALYVDHAGDLWVGYANGQIALYRQGRFREVSSRLLGGSVYQITEDRQHRLWAAVAGQLKGGLVERVGGHWRKVGPDQGLPQGGVYSLAACRDGAVWVATYGKLFLLRPGAARFEDTGQALLPDTAVAQARDGRLWISRTGKGPRPLPDLEGGSRPQFKPPVGAAPSMLDATHLLFDRDGALWGSRGGGLMRIRRPEAASPDGPLSTDQIERFSLADGLSSDIAAALLEDREGDVWLGTNLGLDRFRSANVVGVEGVPVTAPQGYRIAVGPHGGMFVSAGRDLYLAFPNQKARLLKTLPDAISFIYPEPDGTIALGTSSGLWRLASSSLTKAPLPAGVRDPIDAWSGAADGAISLGAEAGIYRLKNQTWSPIPTGDRLPCPSPDEIVADPRGLSWLTCGGGLFQIGARAIRQVTTQDGLQAGNIEIVFAGPHDALFGGDFGLARFDGRAFQTLRSDRWPVLSRISGIVQTRQGETWLNGMAGVVRVKTSDLDAAFAGAAVALPYELYTRADGLPGVAQQDARQTTALEASDGRLWFVTNHGVAWIAPSNVRRNPIPPPVAIRSITADNTVYLPQPHLRLPRGTSNLQIDFTALSLEVPDRVNFQYRLNGIDKHWVQAGTRRQAFYTNLGARDYTFQVIASNNDGVWNRGGASISFIIPPTFVQSFWFVLLVFTAFVALLGCIYWIRLRVVTESIRGRLEERLNERERIARELHDTLLQGFQGLVLRFQAAAESIEPAQEARALMDDALVRADLALVEGRHRILHLRSHRNPSTISEAITKAAETLVLPPDITLHVLVDGDPRTLKADVSDDIVRIGEEALFNAIRHAQCRNIYVRLSYALREFRIAFQDDGVGIAPEIVRAGGRAGHFGFSGMRERAARIGARFALTSRPGAGSEILLSLAARDAYAREARHGLLMSWFMRLQGNRS